MKKGSTINALEARKPRSPWAHIAIFTVFLIATGVAAWAIILREPVEVAPEDWVTHTSEAGHYRVQFPVSPDVSTRAPENDGPIHMAVSNLSMRAYSVAWTDNMAAQIEIRGVEDVLLDSMVKGSESIGGIITNSIEMKWNGHPTREFWLDVPGGKAHYRILAVGTRLYTLAIIHAPSFEPNDDLFFSSFTLN